MFVCILKYTYIKIYIFMFVHQQFAPFSPFMISIEFSLCFTWEKERYQISTADKGPLVL